MPLSARILFPLLALLLLLATTLQGHPDDPKVLDRIPRYEGPGYRGSETLPLGGGPSFPSSGVQLMSWLTLGDFGSHTSGNDCWGYTSPSGREYAIMGLSGGTGFVEITDPTNPVILTVIAGPTSLWRDIKTYQNYAYAVSEGGNGIQVMNLANIDAGSVTHVRDVTVGGNTTATHNVAINEDTGFLYRCGGSGEGIRIYDLAIPSNPAFVASWPDRYVHDAQIVVMAAGPWAGREIAFLCSGFNGGFDQTGIDILDVTNKASIQLLARYIYPGGEYSHQAWLTPDQQYLILNDELDEGRQGIPTTSKVIDVSNLTAPVEVTEFTNGHPAIGHNLYTLGNLCFEANYTSGLRVFDISNPLAATEVAFFDTAPASDAASFNGLWSNYPYFPSGTVIGSDLESGLFVWRIGDPPLTFSFPDGIASLLDPSGDSLRVRIEETAGSLQPGSAKMRYDAGAGYIESDLTSLGGDLWQATFPALPCGSSVDYYFTARDTTNFPVTSPAGAPGAGAFQSVAAVSEIVFFEDEMELNMGWVSGAAGDDATTGLWVRVDPVGTAAQPEDDHSSPGTLCWVTGQGTQLGDNDVDNGRTTLLSPVLDLSTLSEPHISYWRWFSNDQGGAPQTDVFEIDVSNNGGSTWTNVETLGPAGNDNQGGWIFSRFKVSDFVTPTSTVKIRFVAHDEGTGSIVEAAVDDFRVFDYECIAGEFADLAVVNVDVDYDPADGDVDAGPGALAQAVDVLVTVRNDGNIPVSRARLDVDASVQGGTSHPASLVITDFGAAAGIQMLGPGATFTARLPLAAGELDRCGTYTLLVSSDAASLQSVGSGGTVFGDVDGGNDALEDHPDDQSDPGDDFSPDLLELAFGILDGTIRSVSEVIEDRFTEKVRVDVDYTGLGPGGDSHDIKLFADLTDLSGNPVYLGVFSREKLGARSSGMRTLTIKLDVSSLTPAPPPGTQYRVQLRLRDLNSQEFCITSLSANTTTIQ
jgi:choice-of-anchor B domain-containing protein